MRFLLVLLLSNVVASASTVTNYWVDSTGKPINGYVYFTPVTTNVIGPVTISAGSISSQAFSGVVSQTLTNGFYIYFDGSISTLILVPNDSASYSISTLANSANTNLSLALGYATTSLTTTISNTLFSMIQATSNNVSLFASLSNNLIAAAGTNSTSMAVSNIDFAPGAYYTNWNRRSYVSCSISWAIAGNGQTPVSQLWVGTTVGTWLTTNYWSIDQVNANTTSFSGNQQVFGMVGPNQVFTFTNSATGGAGVPTVKAQTSTWLGL